MALKNRSLTAIPDFKLDNSKIPDVKIKSIRYQNFKAFENHTFDFTENGKPKSFICFSGNNGSGKSTILDSIQLIFTRFDGRTSDKNDLESEKKMRALLGKLVRHVNGVQSAIYNKEDDFLITANIYSSLGDYEVQLNKLGFIKDHPEEVKQIVYRLCFYARFDQELRHFQLARENWSVFKDLFESVTGFTIKETESFFDKSDDPTQSEILDRYVLGFMVHKPDEIISHTECSAGERKIIKCFSTLLSKDYMPSVVCVDNIEMHVESGRHIQLIESMKRCFPYSQIFSTTHSYQISKNFGKKEELYDLRLMKASELVKKQPWRLLMADEIKESVSKIKSMNINTMTKEDYINKGELIAKRCLTEVSIDNLPYTLLLECEQFIKDTAHLLMNDIVRP